MLASQYEKECHYVIFLSDGEANYPQGSPDAYVQGAGVPTTFTIFFTQTGDAPQELTDFTVNVQDNGYSTTNPSSNLWAFENTDYDKLMKLIMDSVVSVINQTQTSFPTDIVVNGLDPIDPWDSTGFTFADLFPLIGETTPFVFDIDYHVFVDSITEIGDTIIVEKDTSTHIEFEVVIEDGAPELPDTFDVKCWGRRLEFYYDDNPVSLVDETMDELEIRFTEYKADILYGYEDVSVEITHTEGSDKDKETFDLSDEGSYFAYTFPREIDSTPKVNNDTLQHNAFDSIVAVFRNPKLPLDTLRVTVPFVLSGIIEIECAYYFDNDAEGHVDSIFIDYSTDIEGGLTDDHLDEIKDLIVLPEFRKFTNEKFYLHDSGIAITVDENMSKPQTYVSDKDILIIKHKILDEGGWVKPGTVPIFDRVAPIIHWDPQSAYLVSYQDESITDTLTVKFSEIVKNVKHETPFYFLDMSSGDKVYTAEMEPLGHNNETMVFKINKINDDINYMRDGDSIWIHEKDRVGDKESNFQNNNKNIRRRLYVNSVMSTVEIDPESLTPLDLTNLDNTKKIPDKIISVLKDQGILDDLKLDENKNGKPIGMIIQIVPDDIDELYDDFTLKGDLSIFDAIGNFMIMTKKMAFNKEDKNLVYAWNGKNSNGRYVGSGTYLAYFEIIVNEGGPNPREREEEHKILIGVKD